MKRDDFGTEHPNHAAHLMGSSFPQDQGRAARPFEFEVSGSSRTVFSGQKKARLTASDGILHQITVEFDPVALRDLASGMRQAMNEITVLRQHQQARGCAVQSPCNQQRSTPKRLREQIEDKRRFTIIVAAGEPDGFVEQKVPHGCGRIELFVTHHHRFDTDSARRVPADLTIDADDPAPDQTARLSS
jgi:hypothetical protein